MQEPVLQELIELLNQSISTPVLSQNVKAAQAAEEHLERCLSLTGDANEQLVTRHANAWVPLVVTSMLGPDGKHPEAIGVEKEVDSQALWHAVRESAQRMAQLMTDRGLAGLPAVVQILSQEISKASPGMEQDLKLASASPSQPAAVERAVSAVGACALLAQLLGADFVDMKLGAGQKLLQIFTLALQPKQQLKVKQEGYEAWVKLGGSLQKHKVASKSKLKLLAQPISHSLVREADPAARSAAMRAWFRLVHATTQSSSKAERCQPTAGPGISSDAPQHRGRLTVSEDVWSAFVDPIASCVLNLTGTPAAQKASAAGAKGGSSVASKPLVWVLHLFAELRGPHPAGRLQLVLSRLHGALSLAERKPQAGLPAAVGLPTAAQPGAGIRAEPWTAEEGPAWRALLGGLHAALLEWLEAPEVQQQRPAQVEVTLRFIELFSMLLGCSACHLRPQGPAASPARQQSVISIGSVELADVPPPARPHAASPGGVGGASADPGDCVSCSTAEGSGVLAWVGLAQVVCDSAALTASYVADNLARGREEAAVVAAAAAACVGGTSASAVAEAEGGGAAAAGATGAAEAEGRRRACISNRRTAIAVVGGLLQKLIECAGPDLHVPIPQAEAAALGAAAGTAAPAAATAWTTAMNGPSPSCPAAGRAGSPVQVSQSKSLWHALLQAWCGMLDTCADLARDDEWQAEGLKRLAQVAGRGKDADGGNYWLIVSLVQERLSRAAAASASAAQMAAADGEAAREEPGSCTAVAAAACRSHAEGEQQVRASACAVLSCWLLAAEPLRLVLAQPRQRGALLKPPGGAVGGSRDRGEAAGDALVKLLIKAAAALAETDAGSNLSASQQQHKLPGGSGAAQEHALSSAAGDGSSCPGSPTVVDLRARQLPKNAKATVVVAAVAKEWALLFPLMTVAFDEAWQDLQGRLVPLLQLPRSLLRIVKAHPDMSGPTLSAFSVLADHTCRWLLTISDNVKRPQPAPPASPDPSPSASSEPRTSSMTPPPPLGSAPPGTAAPPSAQQPTAARKARTSPDDLSGMVAEALRQGCCLAGELLLRTGESFASALEAPGSRKRAQEERRQTAAEPEPSAAAAAEVGPAVPGDKAEERVEGGEAGHFAGLRNAFPGGQPDLPLREMQAVAACAGAVSALAYGRRRIGGETAMVPLALGPVGMLQVLREGCWADAMGMVLERLLPALATAYPEESRAVDKHYQSKAVSSGVVLKQEQRDPGPSEVITALHAAWQSVLAGMKQLRWKGNHAMQELVAVLEGPLVAAVACSDATRRATIEFAGSMVEVQRPVPKGSKASGSSRNKGQPPPPPVQLPEGLQLAIGHPDAYVASQAGEGGPMLSGAALGGRQALRPMPNRSADPLQQSIPAGTPACASVAAAAAPAAAAVGAPGQDAAVRKRPLLPGAPQQDARGSENKCGMGPPAARGTPQPSLQPSSRGRDAGAASQTEYVRFETKVKSPRKPQPREQGIMTYTTLDASQAPIGPLGFGGSEESQPAFPTCVQAPLAEERPAAGPRDEGVNAAACGQETGARGDQGERAVMLRSVALEPAAACGIDADPPDVEDVEMVEPARSEAGQAGAGGGPEDVPEGMEEEGVQAAGVDAAQQAELAKIYAAVAHRPPDQPQVAAGSPRHAGTDYGPVIPDSVAGSEAPAPEPVDELGEAAGPREDVKAAPAPPGEEVEPSWLGRGGLDGMSQLHVMSTQEVMGQSGKYHCHMVAGLAGKRRNQGAPAEALASKRLHALPPPQEVLLAELRSLRDRGAGCWQQLDPAQLREAQECLAGLQRALLDAALLWGSAQPTLL